MTRLHGEIIRAMKLPDIQAKLEAQGTYPVGSAPAEFAAFRRAEQVKWARVIKEARIKAQ